MTRAVQTVVRWLIAIVLVSVPLSYIFWQWRFAEHKELAALSYESFNAQLSGSDPPAFWPYALYILLVVIIVVAAVSLIALGLRIIFPSPKPEPKPVAAPKPAPH